MGGIEGLPNNSGTHYSSASSPSFGLPVPTDPLTGRILPTGIWASICRASVQEGIIKEAEFYERSGRQVVIPTIFFSAEDLKKFTDKNGPEFAEFIPRLRECDLLREKDERTLAEIRLQGALILLAIAGAGLVL